MSDNIKKHPNYVHRIYQKYGQPPNGWIKSLRQLSGEETVQVGFLKNVVRQRQISPIGALDAAAAPSSTNTSTDVVTIGSAKNWPTGTRVTVNSTGNGLSTGTNYYLHRLSSTTFTFHLSADDAHDNVSLVDLTGSVSATITPDAVVFTSIPEDAVAAALARFRNEGTAGNWLVRFAGTAPTTTVYSVKVGPGDPNLPVTVLGEGFAEREPPTGDICVYCDNVGSGGVLHCYAGWNDGTSLAAGEQGPQGDDGRGYYATSATSLVTTGSASRTFVTQANLAYTVGARVRATSVGTGEWMEGLVTAVVEHPASTDLTVLMDFSNGTGTHADWNINLAGNPGRDIGRKYTYSTTTTNSDPGSGFIRFDNATIGSVTKLYISETDGDANGIAAWIATWDDSTNTIRGTLIVMKDNDPTKFVIFHVTGSNTDNGTWDTVNLAYVTSNGSFSNNDIVKITFVRTGDKGDTGATGSTGATGATGATGQIPSTQDFRLTLATGYPYYAPQPATPSSTDTSAETTTFSSAHGWVTGTIVTPSATGGGLTAGTRYFVNVVSSTVVSYHTTVAAAEAGTSKVNLTASITAEIRPVGISRTTIWFTPFKGNHIGIYNGSSWTDVTSAEISLALGTLTSGKQYSVFAYSNSGTLTLELGSAWSSDSPGGAIPPDCVLQDGIPVKSGTTTRRLVGVLRTDSTTTTIMDTGNSGSVDAQMFLWNQDNRLPTGCRTTDGTAHSYSGGSYREWNNGTPSIRVKIVCGAPTSVRVSVNGFLKAGAYVGWGFDSTTLHWMMALGMGNDNTLNVAAGGTYYLPFHPIGYHFFVPLEFGSGSANLSREELCVEMDM